jgi:hypothetical protein
MSAIMRREPPEPLWQVLMRHWQHLTPAERQRIRELLRRFKGRPSNLSKREQKELRDLVTKIDAPVLARELYRRRGRFPQRGLRSR